MTLFKWRDMRNVFGKLQNSTALVVVCEQLLSSLASGMLKRDVMLSQRANRTTLLLQRMQCVWTRLSLLCPSR